MVDHRLHPSRRSVTYAVRAPLADWLRQRAEAAARDYGSFRVLDVGCGDRPYEVVFTGVGATYVGCDVEANVHADIHGFADALPVDDGSFDVVLCTQVLEHVPDPAHAVRELRRVLRPGGRALASTHGVAVFHPNPDDLWRWTHAGLDRLFRDNGDWSSLTVRPGAGTAATVSMLIAHLTDLLFKRAGVRVLGTPLVAGLNLAGEALDRAVPLLREPVPGSLSANYHVEAVA
jgi:SAM-dependent methyltransferase